MNEAWRQYQADFNSMTDEEIAREVSAEQQKLDEAESWLEAVVSWEEAGKPRTSTAESRDAQTPSGDPL